MTINRLMTGLARSVAKQRASKAKAKRHPTFGHLRPPEAASADVATSAEDARTARVAELRGMVEGKVPAPAAGTFAGKIAATKKRLGIPD